MAPPPFAVSTRRTVRLPEGSKVLVLIRRNLESRWSWASWDVEWEFELLRRVLRRDRTWRVEVYPDEHVDPGQRPDSVPCRSWTRPDRRSADSLAETVSDQLTTVGLSGLDDL